MKNYLSNVYFKFLKRYFFNKNFKPRHRSFTDELTWSLLFRIAFVVYLIYNQEIVYSLLFIFGAIVLPDLIMKKMKNHDKFFYYFSQYLNHKYKSKKFSVDFESGYLTYEGEYLLLPFGLNGKKGKTLVINSKWTVDSWESQADTYYWLASQDKEDRQQKSSNTVIFSNLGKTSFQDLEKIIDEFIMQANPAKMILNQIRS